MELKVFRDVLPAAGADCTAKAELPLETELLISDYLPPVLSLELVSIVVKSCDMVKLMLKEFASFRHSKSLRDHIIAINTLEEQADQVFVTSMRELHTTCTDPVEIICWREVYFYLEKCTDACEHVADVVEQIVMKNS